MTIPHVRYQCPNCQRTYSDHEIIEGTHYETWKCSCGCERVELTDNPPPTLPLQTPPHYGFKIQPVDLWDDWNLDPYRATALKYIARCHRKGDAIGDIDKAIHYLEMYKHRFLAPVAQQRPTPQDLQEEAERKRCKVKFPYYLSSLTGYYTGHTLWRNDEAGAGEWRTILHYDGPTRTAFITHPWKAPLPPQAHRWEDVYLLKGPF